MSQDEANKQETGLNSSRLSFLEHFRKISFCPESRLLIPFSCITETKPVDWWDQNNPNRLKREQMYGVSAKTV